MSIATVPADSPIEIHPARPSDDPAIVRRTQLADLARSVPLGVLAPLETSVILTIAIKQFDASGLFKGMIAAAGGVGMLASPFVTAAARRSSRPAMTVASLISLIGAAGFLLAGRGRLTTFAIGAMVAVAAINLAMPLTVATYERNFPAGERGKRVGRGMSLKVAVGALAGLAMGAALKRNPDSWHTIVIIAAVASVIAAVCQAQMPSESLPRIVGANRPWPHFHLLGEDRQLRLTLGSWMLMGFGNLMLLPLRVEYLAVEKYGVRANATKIVLLTVVIPSVVRLVLLPVFGSMFDRISFFAARSAVNVLFALYVAAFFSGSSDIGLIIGAVMLGIATAGGDLMWSLWVTKFAPPGRVADYMGLHTFFTGVRALFAPLLAFVVIERFSLHVVAYIAAALMLVSAAVLVPEARLEHRRRGHAA